MAFAKEFTDESTQSPKDMFLTLIYLSNIARTIISKLKESLREEFFEEKRTALRSITFL